MMRRRKIRRSETTAVDLISEFPDSILVHILSFLPIEDAVQTQVLSKRWQFLWTFLPSLTFRPSLLNNFSLRYSIFDDFDDEDYDVASDNDFATFVDKTLLCSNCKLKKFEVEFHYEPHMASNVDSWALSAAGKGVEELYLGFYPAVSFLDDDERYELPQLLYDNSCFKELQFSWCRVVPKVNVAWYSLKRLSISCVKLSNDAIERILAGSPVLEILELREFEGFSHLAVSNSHVKKLILRDLLRPYDDIDSGLEISAPYILSLEISGCLGRNCRLLNAPSLVDAIFNCNFVDRKQDWANDCERVQHIAGGLLASLGHVKNLSLGTWAIEVLSIMEAKGLASPLLKCSCLTLDAGISKIVLPGIANLLGSSPNLETLVITASPPIYYHEPFRGTHTKLCNFDEKLYWTSQKRTFECLMLHLREVKFAGLRGLHSDLNFAFIQFLLENARVLQKMVFNASMHDGKMSQEFFLKLLSFPRSSPNAVVMFYE